jgi:hypothetical protein
MSKNITSAAKFLQKEIARLNNEVLTQQLKESTARENKENALKRIEELEAQLEILDPKTAFASL